MDGGFGGFVERVACPVCGAAGGRELYRCDYDEPPIRTYLVDFYRDRGHFDAQRVAGATFQLVECSDCSLIYQAFVPDDELLAEIYATFITPEFEQRYVDSLFDDGMFARCTEEIWSLGKLCAKPFRDIRFLDYGMGFGHWASVARAAGMQSFGVELSECKVAAARTRGVIPIADDDLGPMQFDVIHTEQGFEHLPRPNETLGALVPALAPGGLLKISVPRTRGLKKAIAAARFDGTDAQRDALNPVSPLEHLNAFCGNAIDRLAANHGLVPVSVPPALFWIEPSKRRFRNNVKATIYPFYRWLARSANNRTYRRA